MIDFTSGLLVANVGHDNPTVMEAVSKCRGWSGWYGTNPYQLKTFETLRSILPPYLDKYMLFSTGSEAIDCALKIADDNGYTIVSHERSYHGSTIGAQWVSGHRLTRFSDFAGEPDRMSKIETIGWISGRPVFILETFLGPFCEWYDVGIINLLREKQKEGAIVIFDEIQAGFGRTGRWFGFEHYKIKPDIVVGGKAAAGGFPFAFVAGRARLLDHNPRADYVSTFSGNAMACAAFVATVKEIKKKKLVQRVVELESLIVEATKEMLQEGLISSYTGKGFAYALWPKADPEKVAAIARKKGLLLLNTGRGTVKIAPPLCILKADLIEGMRIIKASIETVLNLKAS